MAYLFDDYMADGLIDMDRFGNLFDAFDRAVGVTTSIISLDGRILIGSRRQEICSAFHCRHPQTESVCLQSNSHIHEDLAKGAGPAIYPCPLGLMDAAAPIFVDDIHVANLFAGQFLLEAPGADTVDTFRQRASQWGFDETAYIAALSKVPIISENRIRPILQLLKQLAELIGESAVSHLKRREADEAIKHANRALRQENNRRIEEAEKLGQILEGTPIPTFVIDADCRITHWNNACEVLTGIPAADMIGTRRHRDAFYTEPRELLADLLVKNASTDELAMRYGAKFRSAQLTEGGYQGDCFFPRLGETGRWLFFTAVPLKAADGGILGAIETLQDITDRRSAEHDLRAREKELQEKSRYLEKVNQALKASLDHREIEKRAVEENMLVNLKRFVFPYVEELSKCSLNTDAQAYLNIIDTNLNDIVSRFSKTVFSKYIDFTPTEVRIADLIREGRSSKSIAQLLGLSPSSIQWHRKNIREKLGLTNKKANLQSYLTSLAE